MENGPAALERQDKTSGPSFTIPGRQLRAPIAAVDEGVAMPGDMGRITPICQLVILPFEPVCRAAVSSGVVAR